MHQVGIWPEKKKKISKKMTGDSLIEYSFKDKGPAKTQAALLLVSILLVQNSTETEEAGVEEITAAIGTCKKSLNWSWGCSCNTLQRSSQYFASKEMEHSNENLAEFRVLRA